MHCFSRFPLIFSIYRLSSESQLCAYWCWPAICGYLSDCLVTVIRSQYKRAAWCTRSSWCMDYMTVKHLGISTVAFPFLDNTIARDDGRFTSNTSRRYKRTYWLIVTRHSLVRAKGEVFVLLLLFCSFFCQRFLDNPRANSRQILHAGVLWFRMCFLPFWWLAAPGGRKKGEMKFLLLWESMPYNMSCRQEMLVLKAMNCTGQ